MAEKWWGESDVAKVTGTYDMMMTNRYCQAVGCYDAVEAHKIYSPVDRLVK